MPAKWSEKRKEMADKIKKDVIHAKGFDIGIYIIDYENEFISITDIAKYKSDAPNDVIKKLDEK